MKKELRIILYGILGAILVAGGTIAIAIAQQQDEFSYYPILVFFGGILLIYAIFDSLIDPEKTTKISK